MPPRAGAPPAPTRANRSLVLALGAAYVAVPQFWVFLPVELVAVAAGTSVGLHWGHRAHAEAREPSPSGEAKPSAPRPVAALEFPICPDG